MAEIGDEDVEPPVLVDVGGHHPHARLRRDLTAERSPQRAHHRHRVPIRDPHILTRSRFDHRTAHVAIASQRRDPDLRAIPRIGLVQTGRYGLFNQHINIVFQELAADSKMRRCRNSDTDSVYFTK